MNRRRRNSLSETPEPPASVHGNSTLQQRREFFHLGKRCTGGNSHGAGECRTKVNEIVRRAAAEVRHRADESRDRPGAEPGVAGGLGSFVAGDRIVEPAHLGIRSSHRANRDGSSPRSGPAQTQKPTGKKKKHRLDTNRPSHGRTWPCHLASWGLLWGQIRCVHSRRSVRFQAGDIDQESRLKAKGRGVQSETTGKSKQNPNGKLSD
jgi:hypothetical protein